MRIKKYLLLAGAAVLILPLITQAAPPWKEGSGQGHGKNKHQISQKVSRGGPPPWAPAHGYRAKRGQGPYAEDSDVYVSVSHQIGIPDGTCNREAVGSILGGVVGGVIGSEVGRHNDNQALGTVAGTVIGVLVGRQIGRNMDRTDQQCTGQALERAENGQTITWRNPDTGVRFQVTPSGAFQQGDRYCRDYKTRADNGGTVQNTSGTACRAADGTWQLAAGTRL